jgi:hypothetical protein
MLFPNIKDALRKHGRVVKEDDTVAPTPVAGTIPNANNAAQGNQLSPQDQQSYNIAKKRLDDQENKIRAQLDTISRQKQDLDKKYKIQPLKEDLDYKKLSW